MSVMKETLQLKEQISFDFSGFSARRVTLRTADGVNFEIPKELLAMMITVNNMLEGMRRLHMNSQCAHFFHWISIYRY